MTVAELIDKLSKMDQTLPVVVFGYEDGFDDVTALTVVKFEENLNSKDHEGHYNEVEDRCLAGFDVIKSHLLNGA